MATHLKSLSESSPELPSAQALRFGIVVSQWYDKVTDNLYQGAYQVLKKQGALEQNIATIKVPGSYELIAGANLLLNTSQVDVILCLGCVIQGETSHFTFICQAVANGVANLAIKYNKPVIFGVLTTDNLQQALDRSGGKHGNQGEGVAMSAIHMADLYKRNY